MTPTYVKPTTNKTTLCHSDPCLTLDEYASLPEVYFNNYTIFYFYPGIHRLSDSLRLKRVYNISFQGLPTDNEVVKVKIDSVASITWEKSWNIEISSISFMLSDNFTFMIKFEQSLHIHLSNISIFGNRYKGRSSIVSQESELDITNSMFCEIKGLLGAALIAMASNITIGGTNTFVNNTAVSGGSIYLSDSMLTLNGANLFWNNTSLRYGQEVINRTISFNLYYNNNYSESNSGSGGAIFCSTSYLRIYGYSNFTGNFAKYCGGAIVICTGGLVIQGNTFFSRNIADYGNGGAMILYNADSKISGDLSLNNNEAMSGGAICIIKGDLIILANSSFDGNFAEDQGGALYISHTNSKPYRNVYCGNNAAAKFDENHDSAIRTQDYNIVTMIGTTYFYRNRGFDGGAVQGSDSNIIFSGIVHFERNWAILGGAMYLEGSSKLILKPKVYTSFIFNSASENGGALFFRDSQCSLGSTVPIECFIAIDSDYPFSSTSNILLHFENNSARIAGSILYGGQFDECRLFFRNNTGPDQCNCKDQDYSDNALETLMNMSTIVHYESPALSISSAAKKVRFCEINDRSLKLVELTERPVYPGQHFDIPLIALGQAEYPVPTTAFWEIKNKFKAEDHRLSPLSQTIDSLCTNVTFQLYSSNLLIFNPLEIKLYPENPCQNLLEGLTLKIRVLTCPIGFDHSRKDSRCVCAKKLKRLAQNCYIDYNSELVERIKNNFWMYKENNELLILHEFRCPLDYCRNDQLNMSLDNPSIQCDFNRNGTLCGQCKKNFSLALGSLHCVSCENNHNISLIVLFALAGVALVAIIFFLQLTVSVGTLNGLFFYVNIIQANHQAFFPRATINFATIFISWLNLDLGIETCFYDSMDIYAYSWFQFIFPFYVWFLVGCIILVCRYSQSVAKQLGQNPVAVLATLLLMSYSKILQAIIDPLSLTYLTYYTPSNETQSIVWLYDANIHYFKEFKHIALGMFAILSLSVFVLPYIFLLFFGHWLQGCSNWWILSWLNKLKPVMDAYHAPYKKHTRYWTGLLLLSRLGLLLTFAINANGSESVNILAVSSVTIALLATKLLRVYENLHKDVLESSFIVNLGIFSVATFYLKEESEDDENQRILSSISVGIAFITFIGILLFHASIVLKSSNIWKKHMLPFIQTSLLLSQILRISPVKDKTTTGDKDTAELHALPTSTEVDVDLREPLLEISESQAAA